MAAGTTGIVVHNCPPVDPCQVGTFDELKKAEDVGDNWTFITWQRHPAGQVIDGYDSKIGPAIALPQDEQRSIPNVRGDYAGTAEELIEQDLRNLGEFTGAPPEAVEAIADLIKIKLPGKG